MSLSGFLLAAGGPDVTSVNADEAVERFFLGFKRCQPARTLLGDGRLQCCDLRIGADTAPGVQVCHTGSLTLCFDGWLENKLEIAAWCGCAADASDAETVLAAWRAGGDEIAAQLVGEYSFVLWDSNAHRLLAVRDKVGVRPLFYAAVDGGLIVANLPGAVAAHPAVGSAVDYGYAAEFLCVEESTFSDTLYAGVHRLPGGHLLTWQVGHDVVVRRYWQPSSTVRPLAPADAQAQFDRLLRRAVAAAARGAVFVGCDLSGGIDSSSVALQLAQLVTEGRQPAAATAALSLVYPDLPCDETPFIDAVAEKLPFESRRFNARYASLPECEAATAMLRYPFFPFNGSGASPIVNHVAQRHGLLLSGEGGDELFEPTDHALRGALWSGRERPALRTWLARHWAARGRARSRLGLVRYALEPVAARTLLNFIARWRDRPRAQNRWPIDDAWAKQVGISRRVDSLLYPRNSRTLAMAGALSGAWSPSFEWIFFMSCVAGVESRHPLSSAALIEFCNCLPLALLDGQEARNRVLLRQACGAAMPPIVASRTVKAEFTAATLPALLDRAGAQVQMPQCATGPSESGTAKHWFRADVTGARHIWRLDAALSLDVWLRALPPSEAAGLRMRVF